MDCFKFNKKKKKNTNLYKTNLERLMKVDVSREILLLSIDFLEKKKKEKKRVVFATISKTTPKKLNILITGNNCTEIVPW